MARICQLVSVKFGLIFGEADVRKQHEYIFERVYPLLGIYSKGGLFIKDILKVRDYLLNLSPDCRVIGIEESGNWDGGIVEVWESYGDHYRLDWIEQAAVKLDPDMRFSVYVVLPESVWDF